MIVFIRRKAFHFCALPGCVVGVVWRQRPVGAPVIGQCNHRVNDKRRFPFYLANDLPKHVNMLNEQTAFAVAKINRKEISAARYSATAIVNHLPRLSRNGPRPVASLRGGLGPGLPSTLRSVRATLALPTAQHRDYATANAINLERCGRDVQPLYEGQGFAVTAIELAG